MKEHRLSNVTPKILGLLIVGIVVPSTEMFRSSLHSFVQFVEMVAVDVVGESVRLTVSKAFDKSNAASIVLSPDGF